MRVASWISTKRPYEHPRIVFLRPYAGMLMAGRRCQGVVLPIFLVALVKNALRLLRMLASRYILYATSNPILGGKAHYLAIRHARHANIVAFSHTNKISPTISALVANGRAGICVARDDERSFLVLRQAAPERRDVPEAVAYHPEEEEDKAEEGD